MFDFANAQKRMYRTAFCVKPEKKESEHDWCHIALNSVLLTSDGFWRENENWNRFNSIQILYILYSKAA